MTGIEYISSERGRPVSVIYKEKYKNGTFYWKCTQRNTCHGSITIQENRILKETHRLYTPDTTKNELKKAQNLCKNRAARGDESLLNIFDEEMREFKDEGLDFVQNISDFQNLKHRLNAQEEKQLVPIG